MVLRIKLRYPDVDAFVEKFSVNVGRSGLFLTTRGLQPVATELRFELRLADDQVVLAGVGRVAAVYEPDDHRPEAPYGMAIEFMRVTREGRDLVMRMLEHRRSHGLGEPALPVPELDADEAEAMEAEARRSSGSSASLRLPQGPAALEAERPRMPRTRAIELVAHLAAQPVEEAEREAARSEAVALDALLARTATQERQGGAAESVDLARALERARAIAGAASDDDDRFSAELAELSRPIVVPPLERVPQPLEMPEGTLRGVSASMREPTPDPRAAREARPPRGRATDAPARSENAPAQAPPAERSASAEPAPRPEAIAAARPAPPRERFSAFTRRADDPLAEHTPPPGFAPQATPSPHLPAPRPGAPSTLAAAAQLRAEAEAEAKAEAVRTSAEAAPPSASALPDDADTTQPDPEPRRKRVGRPERLTRPPGVFARRSAEATAPPPLDAVIVDTPLPAPAAEMATEAPAEMATEMAAEMAAEPSGQLAAETSGRAMSDATFARVLAELEESDADPPAQQVPLRSSAPRSAGAAAAPYDPLDQLALDDLDDAEPVTGSPAGRRGERSWYATVDETAPVEQIDLDARLDSGIHSLDDSGFEILAEAELANHEALEGTASSAPVYEAPPSRSYRSSPPSAETYDEPAREPITARSALAAAVSRPTWTRSKALDQAEPAQPVNELAPPTIPGRVATRDIDLESALDALDIEADAPAVPLRPREPEPSSDASDDDFPIELEFEDP